MAPSHAVAPEALQFTDRLSFLRLQSQPRHTPSPLRPLRLPSPPLFSDPPVSSFAGSSRWHWPPLEPPNCKISLILSSRSLLPRALMYPTCLGMRPGASLGAATQRRSNSERGRVHLQLEAGTQPLLSPRLQVLSTGPEDGGKGLGHSGFWEEEFQHQGVGRGREGGRRKHTRLGESLARTALCAQSAQSLSRVRLFAWPAARQASLSITDSLSLLKLMSITLVMPSNHLLLCCPLLLLPSIFPSIRVFSNVHSRGSINQVNRHSRTALSPRGAASGRHQRFPDRIEAENSSGRLTLDRIRTRGPSVGTVAVW